MHYEVKRTEEFNIWLENLRDSKAKARISARIGRISLGLFGDCKFLRDSVHEMRIDEGKGYRLYFTQSGREIIFLLRGGDKKTQSADIEQAVNLARLLKKEGL